MISTLDYIRYFDYNFCKGLEYEKHVLKSLYSIYKVKEGYLWKYVPDYLLIESGIIIEDDLHKIKNKYNTPYKSVRNYNILLDTGIDIICKLEDDTVLLVQCKAYSSVVSQKHLSGFFRTILDSTIIYNNRKKIIGLIAHTSSLSEIITSSYCYKNNIITDIHIPFNLKYTYEKNKLKKYKNINIIINFNFIFINIILLLFQLYNKNFS